MGKKTVKKVNQLCKMLVRTSGNVKASCAAIGISTTVFYKWKKDDKKLALAFEDARHQLQLEAENQLFNNVKKGNQRAIEFVLINTMGHKWKHITKVLENDGSVESELDGMTNNELLKSILKLASEMDDVDLAEYGINQDGVLDIEHEEVEDSEILKLPSSE